MHLVELHAQVVDAGALALADLQVEQEAVAIGLDGAQLVELGVKAVVDHAAVAHQGRRLGQQSRVQQGRAVGGGQQVTRPALQWVGRRGVGRLRQLRGQAFAAHQGVGQAHQFARAHLAQRDARGDALHVARALHLLAQAVPQTTTQGADGLQALACGAAVALGLQEPAAQAAAAHAGAAGVEHRQERGAGLAAQGVREFQVAARGRGQVDQRLGARHLHAAHVGECAALGVFGVVEQGAGRGVGVAHALGVPRGQAGGVQLLTQLALAQSGIKGPSGAQHRDGAQAVGALWAQGHQGFFKAGRGLGAVEHLAGSHAGDPVGHLVAGALRQKHRALGHAHPRQATTRARTGVHGQEQGLAGVGQQLGVGQGTGRDHPHHLALHRAFAGGHVAHLFTNRHRLAEFDQARQIRVHRMKGHSGHHHRLASALTALGQSDVKQAHGLLGVFIKELVKIAHAVEHQRVGVLGFDGRVLLHHGCVEGFGHGVWVWAGNNRACCRPPVGLVDYSIKAPGPLWRLAQATAAKDPAGPMLTLSVQWASLDSQGPAGPAVWK